MSGPTVERIENRDPRWLKRFFLLFFLLLPVSGILLFWCDGHHKIKVQAENFAESTIIPALKSLDEPTLLDISTPELADKMREGLYAKIRDEFGPLKSYDRLYAEKTRAREEDDQGVVYAEIHFMAEFEKTPASVRITIRRLSMGEPDPRGGKNHDVWTIHDMEIHPR